MELIQRKQYSNINLSLKNNNLIISFKNFRQVQELANNNNGIVSIVTRKRKKQK